jgi:glycine cleavage system regulatory protein
VTTCLVATIIGRDRPGLVESVSGVVADHGGNWLESRMAQMAGQFAGILRIEVEDERRDALAAALVGLASGGLRVVVEPAAEEPEEAPAARSVKLEVLGADRKGIVRQITHAIAARDVNVVELETEIRSAPMSGEVLFWANARLEVPPGASLGELRRDLERIASDLMVDISVEDGF